jgi:hypothetical protein
MTLRTRSMKMWRAKTRPTAGTGKSAGAQAPNSEAAKTRVEDTIQRPRKECRIAIAKAEACYKEVPHLW